MRKSGIVGRHVKQGGLRGKESIGNSSLTGSKQNLMIRDGSVVSNLNKLAEQPEAIIKRQKQDKIKDLTILGRKKIQSKEYTEAIKLFT